ncbi:MAG: SusC/RagA family TonB-linked outer membrane protein [Bacteroides sp.]|nr:SusC/RagA family TonB-linked outer membrane protein [Bacteroides sp.]
MRENSGEPLMGVNVKVTGTSLGTVTDIQGNYSIEVTAAQKELKFSFMGFATQKIAIGGRTTIHVVMMESSETLEEVVVVGYGTMKKWDVTGAITSVSAKDIENRLSTNVFQALQGQAAGVHIVSGSGQPGESSAIRIRGTSSFSDTAVDPLYIVDGAPMENIDAINPADIKSIEILKDAASAAIYGSRSANGVVIITTKQGDKNKPVIDIKYDHSWGSLSHKLPQANTTERRLYDLKRREFFLEYSPANADESIQMIEDSLNVFFNVDNDYQKIAFSTAQKDQVDLSIGGGSDNLKYFINTGYYSEKGIISNTSYDRLTARINSDYTASKAVSMGTRVSLSYARKKGIDEGAF